MVDTVITAVLAPLDRRESSLREGTPTSLRPQGMNRSVRNSCPVVQGRDRGTESHHRQRPQAAPITFAYDFPEALLSARGKDGPGVTQQVRAVFLLQFGTCHLV